MVCTDIFIKRPVLSRGRQPADPADRLQAPRPACRSGNIRSCRTPSSTSPPSIPARRPNLIQGFITTPIEQAVASAEGVDYMTSSSVQGTSTIQVYIKLNFDPNQALTEVLAKVNSVKYLIPKESNDPIVTKTDRPDHGGDVSRLLQRRAVGLGDLGLSDARGAAGAVDRRRRRLRRHSRRPDLCDAAVARSGRAWRAAASRQPTSPPRSRPTISRPRAGQAKGYFIVSNVSTNTDLTNLDQFKRMIVKSKDGGFVRMEDIATVELAAQSTDASVAFNGEHAIFIGVQATPQGNPLTIVKGVRALLPELERNLPPSMKMKVAYDSTKFIQSSIDEVEKTLVEAVVIVVVVIFLFLASFRSVIIPVVTIPLSLVGVCILMLVAGIQLQPADAAGDGAGDRARGRRRHRGGGEHPSPSGGGQTAGAGGACRARARSSARSSP